VWEILTDRIKTTVGKTPHNQPLSRSTHDIFVLWSFGILFSGILAEQAIKKKDYRDSGLCANFIHPPDEGIQVLQHSSFSDDPFVRQLVEALFLDNGLGRWVLIIIIKYLLRYDLI
jgi:hypothetical protein